MKYHKTKDGKKIKLKNLELSHLNNIIKWIDRKAAQGLKIITSGGDCPDTFYYDEEILYGEDVRKELNYYHYIAELNRRTLKS